MNVSKEMVRVARGAWISPEAGDDFAARCAAVLNTSADQSVIVSTSAARLHGLWLPAGLDDIHIATAAQGARGRAMLRTQRREIKSHRVELRPDEITIVDGLPATTLSRTWRDLATTLGLPALVAAGDCALRLGALERDLRQSVREGTGARGIKRARHALGLLDDRSRSRPESHLRVAASLSGRLPFAVNEPVHRRTGGWLAEPDLSLGEAHLALEYQGEVHADPDRMRKDMTRFADLRREGWLVLPFGPAQVFGRPWEIEAEVRAIVGSRAPHLLRSPRVVSYLPSGEL